MMEGVLVEDVSRRAPGPAPRVRAAVTPACGSSPSTCEIGDALRLVGRAHVLDALHLLARGRPMRFNELRDALGVNANVLSLRLKDLVEAGLVERREIGGAPAAVDYGATGAGRDLLDAIAPLQHWAARHRPPPVHARVFMAHE